MPRFVILEHDHPERHWDFMLEVDGVLRTWKLSAPPRVDEPMPATASFDHRLMYLDYEGPVSGNRGSVVIWDRGTFAGDPGNRGTRVVVQLEGQKLRGTAILEVE
jgi:hypothetical protein